MTSLVKEILQKFDKMEIHNKATEGGKKLKLTTNLNIILKPTCFV